MGFLFLLALDQWNRNCPRSLSFPLLLITEIIKVVMLKPWLLCSSGGVLAQWVMRRFYYYSVWPWDKLLLVWKLGLTLRWKGWKSFSSVCGLTTTSCDRELNHLSLPTRLYEPPRGIFVTFVPQRHVTPWEQLPDKLPSLRPLMCGFIRSVLVLHTRETLSAAPASESLSRFL